MPARNTPVQLLALYTNPKSHSAPRHGQTDRQTTYDGKTALCTKVHRAVKMNGLSQLQACHFNYETGPTCYL